MEESITSLTREKDKLLCLSVERGKVIQVSENGFGACHQNSAQNEPILSIWKQMNIITGETRGNPSAGDQIQGGERRPGQSWGQVNVSMFHCFADKVEQCIKKGLCFPLTSGSNKKQKLLTQMQK